MRLVIYVLLFGALLQSFINSWGADRWVAEFSENFVALVLYVARGLIPAALGIWVGGKIIEETDRSWLAWLVGLTIFAAGSWLLFTLFDKIPGVGWRLRYEED